MSRLQSLLEFFYMETGAYPTTLGELQTQYNRSRSLSDEPVTVPQTEPVRGKRFVYQVSSDHQTYTLKVPNPTDYGVASLELHQIDWGWMRQIGLAQRRRRQLATCVEFMQKLAQVLDQYNRNNRNTYPDSLQALIPKYLRKIPLCPACGKPYLYTHDSRGYVLKCPDPQSHGLRTLEYSSTEGLKELP